MSTPSPSCLEALAAIEADPLVLPEAVEAHVAGCPACFEARVAWLALEDAPPAQAPAGYFDHLPARILRKLPAKPRPLSRRPAYWAMAAGLLLAVGIGGFLAGRANRQPLVEASTAPAVLPEPAPAATTLPTPFQMGDEDMSQLPKLSTEEAQAVIDHLDSKGDKP